MKMCRTVFRGTLAPTSSVDVPYPQSMMYGTPLTRISVEVLVAVPGGPTRGPPLVPSKMSRVPAVRGVSVPEAEAEAAGEGGFAAAIEAEVEAEAEGAPVVSGSWRHPDSPADSANASVPKTQRRRSTGQRKT